MEGFFQGCGVERSLVSAVVRCFSGRGLLQNVYWGDSSSESEVDVARSSKDRFVRWRLLMGSVDDLSSVWLSREYCGHYG